MPKLLTVKFIQAVKTAKAREEVPDGLLLGLYLIVQQSGAKSWAVRYRAEGRPRKLTLGSFPTIDLATARDRARDALRAAAEGRDPAAEKKASRQTPKVPAGANEAAIETVIDQFIQRYVKPNNRPSTASETERLLRKDVILAWRGRTVPSIAKADVLALLDAIVDRGAEIGANRTLAAMRRFFNWCVERGLIETSPCDRVKAPTGERSRDRVLSDAELREVWLAADTIGWPFGLMMQLLILTAQRRSEVAGMRRSELDFKAAVWTIPRERSKNDQAHDVPLSPPVVALLTDAPTVASTDGYVFTTTGESVVSGYSRAKSRLDEAIMMARRKAVTEAGEDAEKIAAFPPWTLHDLRRTAATGMSRLGVALPVVEKILNHSSGSFAGVVGVYQRHGYSEEKRYALDGWAHHVMTLVGDAAG